MKYLYFLLSLALTVTLTLLLNVNNPFGQEVPAVAPLLSPFQGFWQNAKVEKASDYKKLKLKGLQEEVQVIYDERLVPHIFAQNDADAYYAQGYIYAKHRLWQMDIATRAAAGTLSEVLGERMLDYDLLQRRRGIAKAAERATQSWQKAEHYPLLQAYTDGANAYINSLSPKDYPIEYKLLGYAPEEWSVYKTALFQKSMALSLNFRYHDLAATNSLQIFGRETFDFLYPEYNPKQSPVIPAGTVWTTDSTRVIEQDTAANILIGSILPYEPLPMSERGIGSNNWAVNGAKTLSGNPILCNDPHLQLTLPSIWYELQIHTPAQNVYGVALPGFPGVIIGFNEHIAWGITNVGQDVTDWYAIDWLDEQKMTYRFNGKARDAEIVLEEIKVKGRKEAVIDSVRYTHLGPVVYQSEEADYYDLAMHWLSLETPNPSESNTFLALNRAKNYEEYAAALSQYEVPAQNIIFADKKGDIALRIAGKLPIKKEEQGRFVLDGSKQSNEWEGYIPFHEMPYSLNPKRNFVASANQRTTDKNYPYYYNSESFDNYRGRFINRELAAMDSIEIKDMMDLQKSSKSLLAEEALPLMLSYLDQEKLNAVQSGLVKILEDWDYHFQIDEVAPVLFWEWYQNFDRSLWDEIYQYEDSIQILKVDYWKTLEMMEQHALNVFWDQPETPVRETPNMILTSAFEQTYDSLQVRLADKNYTWEEYRGSYIAHLSRSIAPFGRYDLPVDGFKQAPNAVSKVAGPSWRMVVEMGDEIEAYGIYPGGQSGHPGSPYYENMVDKWVEGEYYKLFFMKDANDNRQPVLFEQRLKP
ncbi:MAG: penicillin acylase family protein [Bacteroidota bacterium]